MAALHDWDIGHQGPVCPTEEHWWADRVAHSGLNHRTAARYDRVLEAFARYAAAHGVAAPTDVTPSLCLRFCEAPSRDGHLPGGSTSRVRLAALRSAFDGLVEASLVPENPTLGLRVDRQPSLLSLRPLTPGEALRLFSAGQLSSIDTLRPACVALALTGATHAEVARAVVADADLEAALVRLGCGTRFERTVDLNVAANTSLTARVRSQRLEWRRRKRSWDPESVPLAMHRPVSAYRADVVAPTVSMNLARAMKRAGVTREGVRPRSCREYAANAIYARTGRVEDVAERLGIVSLDAAYRVLDWEWQRQWGQGTAVDSGID